MKKKRLRLKVKKAFANLEGYLLHYVWKIKKKDLEIGILDYPCPCCSYQITSGIIHLPNLFYYSSPFVMLESVNFSMFVRSLTHEFLHKWLHEEIGLKACTQLDNIDKTPDNTDLLIS